MNQELNDTDELPHQYSDGRYQRQENTEANAINIQLFNAGDQSVFTSLYERLYPAAFAFAKRFVNGEDASDIVAKVFCKIWELRKSFDSLNHITKYVMRSIKNACLGHIRDEYNRQRKETGYQYSLNTIWQDEVFKADVSAEKLRLIYAEVENLPKACARVFKLAYIDNLKNDEIAKRLGISVLTVKTQKYNALKAIRMALLTSLALLFYLAHRINS